MFRGFKREPKKEESLLAFLRVQVIQGWSFGRAANVLFLDQQNVGLSQPPCGDVEGL